MVSITPEEAAGHFSWLARFAAWDMPASSAKTREKLGWNPTGPGLIPDLENMDYFSVSTVEEKKRLTSEPICPVG